MAENQNTLPDIKHTILLHAPIQKVWERVSTAEGMALWFMPSDMQPILGHDFHLQTPFCSSPCKLMELESPNRLSFTWDTEGWVVSFILDELGEQTQFTLVHGGWKQSDEILPKANEKSSVIRARMEQGWVGILENLRKALES
ncbi:SRPBCC domain-containing protein [Ammoniphilus sp. CFH 90114]|uniref:SRPBCC family protein n=1 Tax=Ammoniphilus sp. CFH 90114 TaxID=2493665 RepID=UPI001F0C65A3|nr:SRPBCC domain-containing protein [Ammoniphilus sp. CFH 90114]